ncbi:MAG: threonine synthase [Oscillospiraceae bacterium]|jgi:threonine synthase|nr:threonine synthase [Oscillospiraceae bacterium]
MMQYTSTRNDSLPVSSAEAVVRGISADGGLFVPVEFPQITPGEITDFLQMTYTQRAVSVLKKFFTDFTDEQLQMCTESAYSSGSFPKGNEIRLHQLSDNISMLELWHGPTCAFKDMALQILPHLLIESAEKVQLNKKILILVATSGDTGKAALEGFKNVKNTEILVFYPETGVSPMQKMQMATQEGDNVRVCAVKGNFDDCQSEVKKIFTDPNIKADAERSGIVFSSANSINWGRLAPQTVYYISAYADLVKQGKIMLGDSVNVCVPTGNFGNILAAYYAKQMGIPFKTLICASNANNILTDFINTGIYDKNRKFFTTASPSMDILVSSNLERFLYHLSGSNGLCELFRSLDETGRYEVNSAAKAAIKSELYGGFCDDSQTRAEISQTFEKYRYLCDPHTAVALKVYNDYREKTGDNTQTIVVSTANPYKFAKDVLRAVAPNEIQDISDEFEIIERLNNVTGEHIPDPLKSLKNKPVVHNCVITPEQMHLQLGFNG